MIFVPAPVAQLDRVPDYESGGYKFESCRVYFLKVRLIHFKRTFLVFRKMLIFHM